MLSRRQFLGRTAAGVSWLSFQGVVPTVFARAAEQAATAERNDHVLVVVELTGGNDGLNTLVPFEDPLYYRHRPTLAVPKDQVIRLSDHVGLPTTMARAARLFQAGKLAIVQGVGYPKPDRSHFRSMEIWHTASTTGPAPDTGWLGRVLDYQSQAEDNPLRGLSLFGTPQAFQAKNVLVPTVQQVGGPKAEPTPQRKLLHRLSADPRTGNDPLGFLRREADTAYRAQERLATAAAKYRSTVDYPTALGLGQMLRQAAMVITADLGVRLLFTALGSFDTHIQQAATQTQLLTELSEALAAFQQDLEQHRKADRVLVLVFSEFGRRVAENCAKGTDHGAASCLFLAGSPVKGGLVGTYPSLEKLDDGDLVYQVDFRSVYATILEKWLGCPAEKLLGAKYPLLDMIRT